MTLNKTQHEAILNAMFKQTTTRRFTKDELRVYKELKKNLEFFDHSALESINYNAKCSHWLYDWLKAFTTVEERYDIFQRYRS